MEIDILHSPVAYSAAYSSHLFFHAYIWSFPSTCPLHALYCLPWNACLLGRQSIFYLGADCPSLLLLLPLFNHSFSTRFRILLYPYLLAFFFWNFPLPASF
jgi:hypothetical protein